MFIFRTNDLQYIFSTFAAYNEAYFNLNTLKTFSHLYNCASYTTVQNV